MNCKEKADTIRDQLNRALEIAELPCSKMLEITKSINDIKAECSENDAIQLANALFVVDQKLRPRLSSVSSSMTPCIQTKSCASCPDKAIFGITAYFEGTKQSETLPCICDKTIIEPEVLAMQTSTSRPIRRRARKH